MSFLKTVKIRPKPLIILIQLKILPRKALLRGEKKVKLNMQSSTPQDYYNLQIYNLEHENILSKNHLGKFAFEVTLLGVSNQISRGSLSSQSRVNPVSFCENAILCLLRMRSIVTMHIVKEVPNWCSKFCNIANTQQTLSRGINTHNSAC